MPEYDWLAERFQEHRSHLRAVAYRILGSMWETDDVLQEAWLRVSKSDTNGVENLRAWLTTIVARVAFNVLSSRQSRREQLVGVHVQHVAGRQEASDPEHQALLADSVGLALLVVLDTLGPAERLAFVMHDMFDVPFNQIASIIECSPSAARQLASRARRRVRGATTAPDTDSSRRQHIVAAFLAASRDGDFESLVALLDHEVVLRADTASVRLGAATEVRGAASVAVSFTGRLRGAQPALINGAAGAVWAPRGAARVIFAFALAGQRISAIDLLADPESLGRADIMILES
jgi:RNA polymerase sigma factor (sigma-70 family)